ncbi:MAG TPA: CPBP family intramembrane metalloprotease [Polyangiaceae bacterium]|nr:CPBP family intramembrane metalloprotease [Polyangiaceae bacterium]
MLAPNLIAIASGGLAVADLRMLEKWLLSGAIVAFLWTSKWSAIPLAQSFGWPRNVTLKLLGRLALGVLAGLTAAWLLGLAFPTSDAAVLGGYREEGESIGWALLDWSVTAPLLEELIFRGIVLGALSRLLTRSGALWTSALMFASIHLTPLTIVHHTLLGLVTGYARLETRSLLLPVLIHAGYNAVVVSLAW